MAISRRYRQRSPQPGNFDQNDGVAGVVYILRNDAFKEHWLKIGQSRHSGHVRAREMNRTASTGLPAHHVCVFECRTLDCGNAEKLVFQQLRHHRRGRQEFFEVDIEVAKAVIMQVCGEVDAGVRRTIAQREEQAREAAAQREAAARSSNEDFLRDAAERRRRAAEQARQGELDQARREREALEAIERLGMEDMTCPACSIVLSIPAGVAKKSDQKLRCKNCFSVFLPNGHVLSRAGDAPADESEVKHSFVQEMPPKSAPPTPTRKVDGLVGLGILVFVFVFVAANWRSEPAATPSPPPPQIQPSVQERPSEAPPPPAQPPAQPPKTDQELLNEAAEEMAARYPYLNTSSGAVAVEVIRQRRDELMAIGISPPSALRIAVLEVAPRFAPPP